MTQSVMDRLLMAGLCGNTLGQDIQTLTYHSSTSNMAFHLKDVCSSNFTWPAQYDVNLEKCALLKCLCGEWKRVCCRTGSGVLTCS